MGTKSVQALLEDIRLLDEGMFSVVRGVLTGQIKEPLFACVDF